MRYLKPLANCRLPTALKRPDLMLQVSFLYRTSAIKKYTTYVGMIKSTVYNRSLQIIAKAYNLKVYNLKQRENILLYF